MKPFLRRIWSFCGVFAAWINLELEMRECSACGTDAVWKISRSVYVCDCHYQWGVNRAVLLGEEVIIEHLKSLQLQRED